MKFAAHGLLFTALAATSAFAQTPNTPFQHVIIVVQENRSPDNLFGSDLFNKGGRRLPNAHLAPNGQGKCGNNSVPQTAWSLASCFDPDHSHDSTHFPGAWEATYNSGGMNGACNTTLWCGNPQHKCQNTDCGGIPNNAQYTYVDNTPGSNGYGIVEPYFQIALNYGFANWMFQTNQGPSWPAHQFLFTGTSAPTKPSDTTQCKNAAGVSYPCYQWFAAELAYSDPGQYYGCVAHNGAVVLGIDPGSGSKNTTEEPGWAPPWRPAPDAGYPCYDHNTMTDLLEAQQPQQVTWRYYSYNDQKTGGYNLWDAPTGIEHICQPNDGGCSGSDFSNGNIVQNSSQILTDLGANPGDVTCSLQQVSWVIPDGTWSDHPGDSDAGPSWVAAIVNAVGGYYNNGSATLGNCGYWNNTVVLITWDDWGGWYDDVLPWNCESAGNGGECTGYSNGSGKQYVYGFRVPLLVVSAWTPPDYVSGSPSQGGEVLPYVHDFGSILNFTEWALGQNQTPLSWPGYAVGSGISPQYPYADYLAPDVPPSCPPTVCQPWSLADFFLPFNTGNRRNFTKVTGWKYDTYKFLNPSQYFSTYPSDPDDDAIESQ